MQAQFELNAALTQLSPACCADHLLCLVLHAAPGVDVDHLAGLALWWHVSVQGWEKPSALPPARGRQRFYITAVQATQFIVG